MTDQKNNNLPLVQSASPKFGVGGSPLDQGALIKGHYKHNSYTIAVSSENFVIFDSKAGILSEPKKDVGDLEGDLVQSFEGEIENVWRGDVNKLKIRRTAPLVADDIINRIYLDSGDVDALAKLARKISTQAMVVNQQPALPAAPERAYLSLTAMEAGFLFISIFGSLLILTYVFKVQFVHPLIGISCIFGGGTYMVMDFVDRRKSPQK